VPILKNERHELFAQKLAEGKSATEAYQLAGFKPSRKNASRLRANEDIVARVQKLQETAARSTEVSIQSLIRELDDAIKVAKAKGQAQAMVSAAGMKAKLAGLMVEKQELRVSGDDYFTDDMSYQEILDKVAADRGVKPAYYLAKAFDLDPSEFGLSLDSEPPQPVAKPPVPAVTTPPKPGYSQR
jgi:phage terminase small subunit